MSDLSPEDARLMRDAVTPLAGRWVALHQMAAQVGHMAQLAPEPFEQELAGFPAQYDCALPSTRALAGYALDDIEALLHTGLTALEAIAAREGAVQIPALTLWREFYTARAALIAMIAQSNERHKAAA